eukprot:2700713-Prorocentrum_lima.AAC.1
MAGRGSGNIESPHTRPTDQSLCTPVYLSRNLVPGVYPSSLQDHQGCGSVSYTHLTLPTICSV